MFRVELKSCEESRILLGKRFSSVQGFFEGHIEISGWSVCDFHCEFATQQVLTRVTDFFQYKVTLISPSDMVI